jgi:DNA-binding NarL/FixJ family response regulator
MTRILIADDSSLMRRVLRKLLESHSNLWQVCAEAVDGLDAVQKAVESRPDVVIIDLQMPSMDGLSASARIAKSLPKVSILINTNHKSDYVDSAARRAGVREVIAKSDSDALLKAVEGLQAQRA